MFKKLTTYITFFSFAIVIALGVFLFIKNNSCKLSPSETISKELFWFIKTIVGVAIAILQLLAFGIIKVFTETKTIRINSEGISESTIEKKSVSLIEKEPKIVALGSAAVFVAIMLS